jgi:RNA polymerase sigma factor (sigma-70 family)
MTRTAETPLSSAALERIRAGDRDAAADYGLAMAPLIRRRIRGKLGPRMRRMFDSFDIVSTVLRRLDLFVAAGQVRASSEDEFRALIMAITQNAVIDKTRILQRLQTCEGEDAEIAKLLLARAEHRQQAIEFAIDDSLDFAVQSLTCEVDKTILWLWLTGMQLQFVAQVMGLSTENARQRWLRIRARLREAMEIGTA